MYTNPNYASWNPLWSGILIFCFKIHSMHVLKYYVENWKHLSRTTEVYGKKNALSKIISPYCVFSAQKNKICVHTGLYSCTMILSENAVFWPRFSLQANGTWNQRSKSVKKTPRLWYLEVSKYLVHLANEFLHLMAD